MKTADGVDVYHGMTVWPAKEHEVSDEKGGTIVFAVRDNATGDILIQGDEANIEKLFATRK